MKKMELKVSLARIYYPVKVLGPGDRVGIWMNGCTRKCSGCISPELQRYDKQKEVSIGGIMDMIGEIPGHIDGFTISGGEPFYCPDSLNALVKAISTINDDILIFTGYTLEELRSYDKDVINSVLDMCAAIVDGPYIRELNDGQGLRGSSNQKCRVFRYAEKYADIENARRQLQTVLYGETVLTIGIPQGGWIL